MFKAAGPAEIVRSQQKDDYYVNYLRGLLTDVIHQFIGPRVWVCMEERVKLCTSGPRVWLRWHKEIDVCADLGYFILTTLSGYQTIGEEYVSIVQVDESRKRVPSPTRRGLMVLLHILTPYLLRRFFEWLEKTLRSPDSQEIPLETREFLLKSIPIAKTVVLYCHRLHMAVFYLQGLFYQIAKRISGVQYLQRDLGFGKEDDSVTHSFKVLGWVTLTQLFGSCIIGAYRMWNDRSKQSRTSLVQAEESETSPSFVSADRKCALCLEERKHSSVTPCGHLFCWQCIHDWCSNKAECPLCRDKVEQHRIVPLQNFDPP